MGRMAYWRASVRLLPWHVVLSRRENQLWKEPEAVPIVPNYERSERSEVNAAYETVERTFREVQGGRLFESLDALCASLFEFRSTLSAEEWSAVTEFCFDHPLSTFLQQSPLTARALHKPRGYPGDAEILDYLYGAQPLPRELPSLVRKIYAWECQRSGTHSVRARRDLLADEIDAAAARVGRARILSLACGHLREAELSEAVPDGRVEELVALDQDAQSLAVVAKRFGRTVTPVCANVRDLIRRRLELADFDLIYAAGLFDYLADPVARALVNALVGCLGSGGKLLVANFAPNLVDIGYLECFLDWRLIYRDEAAIRALAADLSPDDVKDIGERRDKFGNIVFLEVLKR